MNIPEEMYQMKMYQKAKHLGVMVEPIALFENRYLYRVKDHNYYDDYLVHPEFYNLMHIPFSLSVSINFLARLPRVSESEKPRRKVINDLLRHINSQVLDKCPFLVEPPYLASGRQVVRAAWAIELGALNEDQKRERHAHILLHFHKNAPSPVHEEIMTHLKSLSREERECLGLSKMDVQMIAGRQGPCVSYFCKIQRGYDFKVVEYSPNFKKVVERKFVPSGPLPMDKAA